jgi:enoyl-[acyl-carrier protein] reductase II
MRTPFHDIFKTRYPIIQAGMGPYDTTRLAAAVAKAGGLGPIHGRHGIVHAPGIGSHKYSAIFGRARRSS